MFQFKIDEEVSLALPRPKIDAEAIYALIDDSRDEIAPWLTWANFMKKPEDEEKFLVKTMEHF